MKQNKIVSCSSVKVYNLPTLDRSTNSACKFYFSFFVSVFETRSEIVKWLSQNCNIKSFNPQLTDFANKFIYKEIKEMHSKYFL